MINCSRRVQISLFALLAALLVPATALVQPVAHCSALITDAEVTKAVGTAMRAMGSDERGKGTTECKWMLAGQGAFKTLFVGLETLASQSVTSTGSVDKLFELYVSTAEEQGKSKRTALPGVGQKAAIIAVSEQTQTIIQRTDGVVKIVSNGLTRAQITALAQDVMTP
ncbi:MAG TPA: hypothetical protein VJM31_14975 [Vicinamibacterales bacterium]|nr:hypothetical protein [Vicinamibacterales bacterium]